MSIQNIHVAKRLVILDHEVSGVNPGGMAVKTWL